MSFLACERFSCCIEGVAKSALCITRSFSKKIFSTLNLENWDGNALSNSPKAFGTKLNSLKKGSIAKCCAKVCASWAKSLRAEIRRKITWGDFYQEGCASRAARDLSEKCYQAQEFGQSFFCTDSKARMMLAPTSERPEERVFAVDSGASRHMKSWKRKEFRRILNGEKVQNPQQCWLQTWKCTSSRKDKFFQSRLNLFF